MKRKEGKKGRRGEGDKLEIYMYTGELVCYI